MQNIENLMLKKLIFSFSLICLFIGWVDTVAQVNVTMLAPAEVTAGKEFSINIVIQKGALEEFSRFQQLLPVGLKAIQDQSGSADFSFENQMVRYIWLKLPPEEEINISYKVMVNERLKGTFSIKGEFSYVEDDVRKSVDVEQASMVINPSPTIAESEQVDISEFADVLAAEKAEIESRYDITCIRQIPYKTLTGNDIIVKILVYKKDMNKFAKIEEQIPDGFDAKSMDSKEGIFTFKDGLAKFVWMNLPPEPGFIISYRLIPTGNQTVEDVTLTGKLSYIEQGRNVEVDIIQKSVDLEQVDEANIENFLASVESGEAPPPPPPPKDDTEKDMLEKDTETVTETQPLTKEPQTTRHGDIPPTRLLPVETGTYYRVQLAAVHRLIDPVSVYKKYNFDKPVKIEFHEGWYKYTIGSFYSYSDAKAFKDIVVTKKKISGAFITAYQNGQRITVPEAMKLTGDD